MFTEVTQDLQQPLLRRRALELIGFRAAEQSLTRELQCAASDTVAAARDSASSFESVLRNTIETQPYTAVVMALGVGWLLGRMHRPI